MFRTTRVNLILAAVGFAASMFLASSALADPPQWSIFRPSNTGILGDTSVTIWIDDQDRPWIGAYTTFWEAGGMSRKNPDGTWTAVSSDDSSEIASPRFFHIAKAPNGVLWIGTWGSLLKYDPAVGNSSLQRYDPSNSPLPDGKVYDVAVAPDGTVWCAVDNVNNTFLGGLARFNPATNAWTVWNGASGMPWASACAQCSNVPGVEIQNDATGGGYTVWFYGDGGGFGDLGMASYRNGAFTWYGKPSSIPAGAPITPTGLFSDHSINDQNELLMKTNQGFAKRSPSGAYTLVPTPPISSVNLSVMVPLNNGRYGAASYVGEVYLFNGASWEFLGNWNGNHNYAMDEESNGALWVSGIGGAARYANGQFQRYRITNTGPVGYFQDAVAFGTDGKVYLDGNAGPGYGGFETFDGTHWTCVNNFNYGLGPVWGLPSDDVQAMYGRANGHMLISPSGIQGLFDWDGSAYTPLIPQGWDIISVTEDTLGRAWAAQYNGGGLLRVTSPGQFMTYTSSNSQLYSGDIEGVVADPAAPGWVWTATFFGLVHTDGVQWEAYSREILGLTQNSSGWGVWCFDRAPDGTLWIGTGRGLYYFNPTTLDYTRYTKANSSLVSDEIHAIEVAPDGSVWVANQNAVFPYLGGLSHFDGTTWTTYTTANSPLRHTQNGFLDSRAITGGYEVWVGMMSEGVARITVPTAAIPGDINGDNSVDVNDLLLLIGAWGQCSGTCPADFNLDMVVDVNDLLILIGYWG